MKLREIISILTILLTFIACDVLQNNPEDSLQDGASDFEQSTPNDPGQNTPDDIEQNNPNDPFANATGKTREVSNLQDFLKATKDLNVSVIKLTTDITTTRPAGDNILILGEPNRSLTINGNGNTLTINDAGIVLGGNLQFSNITLDLANVVRNAIIANGYNLTLDSVKQSPNSKQSIHLFCGTISNYTDANNPIPAIGSHGQIVVKGKDNKLGHIFAGSLDDAANEGLAKDNEWKSQASIIWQPGTTGTMGIIYAHGSRESRGDGDGNKLIPSSEKYRCSNNVQINLSNGASVNKEVSSETNYITIEGATGGTTNASVRYTDDGNGYQNSPLLKNIGGLELVAGTNKANLAPATGSSFQETAKLMIPANTELHLTNLSNTDTISVSSLSGGGILVLNQQQKLSISGEVSGTTQLAIGGLSNNRQNSTNQPKQGYSYISASQSEDSSFNLLPPVSTTNETFTLERDQTGNWFVNIEEEPTIVKTFSLKDAEVDAFEIVIPVNVTYKNGTGSLTDIPASITAKKDNNSMDVQKNDSGSYSLSINDVKYELFFTLGDSGEEILYIAPLPSDTYQITVTIPASHSDNGKEITTSTKKFTVSQN